MITAKQFKKATGYAPRDDDLERCNCPKAGQLGHTLCGWSDTMGMPSFIAKAFEVGAQVSGEHDSLRMEFPPEYRYKISTRF